MKKYTQPFYKNDLGSVAAWVWLEAIVMNQQEIIKGGQPFTPLDAARAFLDFMGYEKDENSVCAVIDNYHCVQGKFKRLRGNHLGKKQTEIEQPETIKLLLDIEQRLGELIEQKESLSSEIGIGE